MRLVLARRTRSPAAGPSAARAQALPVISAHRLDLHLRCGLPQTGQGRGPDPAGLQYRRDEPTPRRDRQDGRARCPRRPLGRSGWLAHVDAPRRATQHHHYRPATEMPRAKPGRERLAIYARQLALEPVSYTHLRAHETVLDLVCRLL